MVRKKASDFPPEVLKHGFHNDTTPRYDEAAAKLSWERTLAFFKAHPG
jgi:carboxymethylenebutenolidase